jgi:predicted branched-subunit amino acid permease
LVADPEFRRGSRDMGTFVPALIAWGMVTGVAMVQTGMGVGNAVLMSLVVFAGTAQLTALPLIAAQAPAPVVWASAAAVNLRFVLFSLEWRKVLGHLPRGRRIALGYFLADLNLVLFQKAWGATERAPGQVPYTIGGAATSWVTWQLASLAGIAASSLVPLAWGLGFVGVLSMLGLAYGLLVDRGAWLAAAIAALASVAAFALPLKLNILVAIVGAVAAALLVEAGSAARRRMAPPVPGDVPPAGGRAPEGRP